MSQRSGARSIASYFQPATRAPATPQPQSQSQPAAAAAAAAGQPSSPASRLTSLPPTSSPPPSFSSPTQPRTATPRPKRAEVIAASDDEGGFADDDSDDEFVDIAVLLGSGPSAASAPDPLASPSAKRTAVRDFAGLISPAGKHAAAAAARPHRFDLEALARDARRDEATSASSLSYQAVAAAAAAAAAEEQPPRSLALGAMADVDGADAHKVLRAVQRTELAKPQAWCCFFDRDYRTPPGAPAPRPGRDSPWRLLTQGTAAARERNLASGVPQTLVARRGGLPDDVFHWILDELCVCRSSLARIEYCNIVADCPDQVARLLGPERLRALFLRLGASDGLESLAAEMTVSKPSHNPYQERDWACVLSFLSLLGRVADDLSTAAAVYAVRVLLRMAFDKVILCDIDLLTAWDAAANRLASAIPQASWDPFCHDTCALLHANIKEHFIRTNALLCLSPRTPASHDLRRRLAAAYLFDDPRIASRHPDDVVSVRRVAERLAADDFAVSKDTDFVELKARVLLLDIVVDDGCAPAAGPGADAETRAAFDADVDELVSRLVEINGQIVDSGIRLERAEAKTALDWVQERLTYSVRTRRPAKKSVYEDKSGMGGVLDAFLPRQQEMMRSFFQKAPKAEDAEPTAAAAVTTPV